MLRYYSLQVFQTDGVGHTPQATSSFAPTLEELDLPDAGLWRIGLRVWPVGWILFILTVDIGLFVSTEQTIQRNRVGPGEGQWTFGQTLALLVVVFPIMDLLRQIREMRDSRRRRRVLAESGQSDANDPDGQEMSEVCVHLIYASANSGFNLISQVGPTNEPTV